MKILWPQSYIVCPLPSGRNVNFLARCEWSFLSHCSLLQQCAPLCPMSPNSDWNTLHAPISFLPHCLVHFWAACASPTASRPLDLPSTPRGCPVLLSKNLSCCRTLFCLFSNNHSQASNLSLASHTSQSEIQFFPLVLIASHYFTHMQICHLP